MSDSIKSQEGMTRREVVFAGAAGIAGLAIGGGVVGALTGGSDGEFEHRGEHRTDRPRRRLSR